MLTFKTNENFTSTQLFYWPWQQNTPPLPLPLLWFCDEAAGGEFQPPQRAVVVGAVLHKHVEFVINSLSPGFLLLLYFRVRHSLRFHSTAAVLQHVHPDTHSLVGLGALRPIATDPRCWREWFWCTRTVSCCLTEQLHTKSKFAGSCPCQSSEQQSQRVSLWGAVIAQVWPSLRWTSEITLEFYFILFYSNCFHSSSRGDYAPRCYACRNCVCVYVLCPQA